MKTNGVYLIHFEPKFKHAKHYLGYTDDIERRFGDHQKGRGARLTQVVVEAGHELKLVRMWPGEDRNFERSLKNRKNAPKLCPCCNETLDLDHGLESDVGFWS